MYNIPYLICFCYHFIYSFRIDKFQNKLTDKTAELYSLALSQAISMPCVLMDLMRGLGDLGGLTGAHLIGGDGSLEQPHVTFRASLSNGLGSQYEANDIVYS